MRPNLERFINILAIRSEFRICVFEPTLWEIGKWLDKILRETVGNFLGNTNARLFERDIFSSHRVSDVRNKSLS